MSLHVSGGKAGGNGMRERNCYSDSYIASRALILYTQNNNQVIYHGSKFFFRILFSRIELSYPDLTTKYYPESHELRNRLILQV